MNGGRPHLVTIGDNCLDVYLTKAVMTVGGCALNVAAYWRLAGRPARYFGAVGDDAEAAILLDAIAKAGLAPGDVERRPGQTAVTLLRENAGDRIFLLEDLGVGKNYMPPERLYPTIAGADWVHLGLDSNPDLVRRLVAERVAFSVDLSTAHDSLPLEGVQLVFASGPEDPHVPVEPIAARLNSAGAREVVVTCGNRGAFLRDAAGTMVHARPRRSRSWILAVPATVSSPPFSPVGPSIALRAKPCTKPPRRRRGPVSMSAPSRRHRARFRTGCSRNTRTSSERLDFDNRQAYKPGPPALVRGGI